MKMEPNYTEYEDRATLTGLTRTPALRSEGPVKRVTMATTTGRIMDRNDAMFKRSRGQWNIRRKKVPHYWKLYMQDPFHTVVNMRLSKVLGALAMTYIVVIVVFGTLYMTPPDECKLAIDSFFQGFSFSVSVLFTIGFGTNGGDTIITLESFVGILLDALAIGLLFQRFSRAQARANTIVMSTHACVRRIRGHLYFMFQVCEMRKHQLVEAHVRMYTIRHDVEAGEQYYFQSTPMTTWGGMLLLALPSVVVHRMDAWSPLLRPKSAESFCGVHHHPATSYLFPEPLCRAADVQSGDRDDAVPRSHTRSAVSNHNTCRCKPGNAAQDKMQAAAMQPPSIEEIKQYWAESQLEVVVLVEGLDAVTSATIQVRHSYKADDILFNHRHVNCVDVDPETGGAVIDFNRFHETQPVDPDCTKVAGSFY
ncbi:hypothetical protein PsorP6_013503 [Peronosclerospora sorghi]|uniref:Uncharacterized protein n=1 Tax=Peronosclerospora sorghi TaxID=230839 RepID=A0ACC0VFC8_9STRA|nr:hypothetical protein PsorP6_013503 [Peronosclerospora sorghi]